MSSIREIPASLSMKYKFFVSKTLYFQFSERHFLYRKPIHLMNQSSYLIYQFIDYEGKCRTIVSHCKFGQGILWPRPQPECFAYRNKKYTTGGSMDWACFKLYMMAIGFSLCKLQSFVCNYPFPGTSIFRKKFDKNPPFFHLL